MNSRHGRNRAFTIVELLVVIGIITILLGMLLPSLQGVQKRSRKAQEINNIKQVGVAWTLYSNSNDSAALPGYLEPQQVQPYWQVTYEYPDGSVIPTAFAAPWTWRLLPYLDNALVMVHGYRDLVKHDIVQDWDPAVEVVDPVTHNNRLLGELIASEPAFGYNAFYVGGWWDEMVEFPSPDPNDPTPIVVPRFRYWDTTADRNGDGTLEPVSVVARYPSQITRPSDMVIFCSSAELSPQLYRKWPANRPGAHVAVPPILADAQQWRAGLSGSFAPQGVGPAEDTGYEAGHGAADPRAVLVVGDAAEDEVIDGPSTWAPIGRHTRLAAVLYADGHTDTQSPAALADQTKWIYGADGDKHFVHTP